MCKAAGKESAMKQDTLTGAADKQPLVSVIMPAYKHRLTRAHREKQLKMSCQALHNAPPNRT